MCIPPIVERQRLGKHVPAAKNIRNNGRNVGRVCLWVCLCIPLSLLGNNSVKTFPRQRRIVRGVVFYTIHVVSKELLVVFTIVIIIDVRVCNRDIKICLGIFKRSYLVSGTEIVMPTTLVPKFGFTGLKTECEVSLKLVI
jgi:hypothetical protein